MVGSAVCGGDIGEEAGGVGRLVLVLSFLLFINLFFSDSVMVFVDGVL